MPRPKSVVPSYRLHKASGQAVVYINRREVYLGLYGSPESRRRYAEVLAERDTIASAVAESSSKPKTPTVNEVLLRFTTDKLPKYVNRDGTPSAEQDCYRGVIRILRDLFGESDAVDFGPLKFRLCREQMVNTGWARSHINKQCQRLRAIFKFAAGWEMIPGSVVQNLKAVEPLMPGDSKAPETKKRRAVPLEHIDAAKKHLRQKNIDLVELLLATAARPGELLSLTTAMIQNRTERGGVWVVELEHHKTEHHGHDRKLFFNAACQQILAKYLDLRNPTARLFPTQRKTLGTAIADACVKAGVPKFTSHWLRHTALTRIADESGTEAAQRVAGHGTPAMTVRYSTAAEKQASEAVQKLG